MNKTNSLIVFGLWVVLLAGIIWAFIHGAKIVEGNTGTGIGWMAGAVVVFILGIFLTWKLKK